MELEPLPVPENETQKMEHCLNYIQQEGKENSILRRNTLKLIYDEIKVLEVKNVAEAGSSPGEDGTGDAKENPAAIYVAYFPRAIITRLADQLERTRELAYDILGVLLSHMTNEQVIDILPYLVPRLVERLGQQELIESSEEVRLVALNFMEDLVEKMTTSLAVYIDDFLQILATTITDDFHSVRIISCNVVSRLAKSNQQVFHYNSERLIKPLCISIAHQRYLVRCSCVQCIGDVIQYGNHKLIDLVIPHITQRLFDSTPQVRKAVAEVVGGWMISYVDRYSFFHKLLPLLLTGLGDETTEVSSVAKDLWNKVGLQYLEENIEEYKDQADYPTETPEHYPKNVERPNLGCRVLACQHASKLIPGLGAEITDWVLSTRVKSAQLMYNLILNSEEKITMHVESVLQCLFKASQDEDPTVFDCVLRSAELIGYFVPLTVTWPIIMSRIKAANNDSGLVIGMSVLKGTRSEILEKQVGEVVDVIQERDICQSMKPKIQKRLLEICNILIDLGQDAILEFVQGIFVTLLTILAVTKDPQNSGRAYDLLRKFEGKLGLKSFEELMGKYCGNVLKEMKESSSEWTLLSADKQVFDLIMSNGDLAVSNNIEIILDIMVANLGPEKDPEVRLKFFTMLAKHLKTYSQTTATQKEQLQNFAKHIIEDVLDPNLVWTAGKTACALRTAAASCLHAILESNIMDSSVILELSPKLETTLLGLVEDTPELTRVLACETLRLVVENCDRKIPPDRLHKIYGGLLKRLDDVGNIVRTSAACTITAVFMNTPTDYDVNFFKVHLQNVYSVLLIHLDDKEEDIQEVMFDAIREIGKLLPSCVIEECQKMKMKHRSSDLCEKLINIFETTPES